MSKKNLGELLESDAKVAPLKKRTSRMTASTVEARTMNSVPDPKEKRVRIVLEENENIPPTGQFISANGRAFMLRPGEEADVPLAVINILNDAVQSVPTIDPATQQVIGYRKKLRFPYRLVTAAAA